MTSEQRLACPDCKLDLTSVASGSAIAHRCPRCRGIWLDPASFRRLCEDETRPPGEDTALLTAPTPTAQRRGPRPQPRVRYRACPACGEVMNRSNFGRASGVVIDVCRAHGAWFDRGELGAIRRFLREGGLQRYERIRRIDAESARSPAPAPPGTRDSSLDDLYDLLFGGGGWDVPSRVPRLVVAAVFTGLGGWLLWAALARGYLGRMLGAELVLLGLGCLYLAWRAFADWAARPR